MLNSSEYSVAPIPPLPHRTEKKKKGVRSFILTVSCFEAFGKLILSKDLTRPLMGDPYS